MPASVASWLLGLSHCQSLSLEVWKVVGGGAGAAQREQAQTQLQLSDPYVAAIAVPAVLHRTENHSLLEASSRYDIV